MHTMADMISTQANLVDELEDNISATEYNVNEGKSQLYKYYDFVTHNRGLIIKIFIILIVIILFAGFIRR